MNGAAKMPNKKLLTDIEAISITKWKSSILNFNAIYFFKLHIITVIGPLAKINRPKYYLSEEGIRIIIKT